MFILWSCRFFRGEGQGFLNYDAILKDGKQDFKNDHFRANFFKRKKLAWIIDKYSEKSIK